MASSRRHASARARRIAHTPPSSVYTKDYFLSDACEGYESYSSGGVSLLKRREIELLEARPPMRVLDVGCGRGEVVSELRKAGVEAVGVDYAADAVELAQDLLGPQPVVSRADATALPFGDGLFDRVLMGDVIEHLPWEVGVEALREIGRVIRPGGFLIVHTSPNRWFATLVMPPARLALRLLGKRELYERIVTYEERKEIMHPNELSPYGLRKMVAQAGLKGRVWVSDDIMRSGSGPWTEDLSRRKAVRLLARIGGAWPFRLFLGNDLLARVTPG